MICPDTHKHGETHTCYGHGCRCDDCREAHRITARYRRRQKAKGTYSSGLVDAGPVRAHIMRLRESGVGARRIAHLTGIAQGTVGNIMWGRGSSAPGVRVSEVYARQILAVQPGDAFDEANVDGTGTWRRLQALSWLGWSWTELARRSGVREITMQHLGQSRNPTIKAGSARAVAELYDRLWDAEPPRVTGSERMIFSRVRNRARRAGWVGPLAWDDETIDNPDATASVDADPFYVDDTSVEAAVRGEVVELNPSEKREAVTLLTGWGWSASRIAAQVGCSERTVVRIRTEHNIPVPGRLEVAA